jgi:MFS superfamily sulfate permease-like transporter
LPEAVVRRGGSNSPWFDVGAGLCVAGLLIPEAVAYAGLARLPVTHALTAALVGLLAYALFGGSRFAIVAPTSSTATLAAAAALTLPGTAYADAIVAISGLAGVILILLAAGRQGQLSAFVSRPVLRSFAFALAITIVVKQLPDALGLSSPTASDPWRIVWQMVTEPSAWHAPTVAVTIVAGALIVLLRRRRQIPASLVVMILAILAAKVFDLHSLGVAEVGVIERPTLGLGLPDLTPAAWFQAAELAIGLTVLIVAESWGSMRTLALAHGDVLDPDREFLVLGAINLGTALLQGMPVGAGFSASSANAEAGARSRWAGAAALVVMVLALAFALPALRLLPRPVLAVAVVSALWHALSPRPLVAAWKLNRDRFLIVAATLSVLVLGVLNGLLLAVAVSVVAALRRFSLPIVHELGQLRSSRDYVHLDGQPDVTRVPGLLLLRPEEPLFFASAERVASEVMRRLDEVDAVQSLVVSLEESVDLDSTALECLQELNGQLRIRGIRLVLARVKEAVRDLLERSDPAGLGHPDRLFWSVDDAVQAMSLVRDRTKVNTPSDPSQQSNGVS